MPRIAIWPGLLVLLTPGLATASLDLRFRVLLNDSEIGYHNFRVVNEAGRETIDIDANFKVTFLAIPVYRYDHNNREVWRDGCLEEIESVTDDNGDEYRVDGRNLGEQFKVATQSDQFELESDCVMTFAYWNREFLGQGRLLNAQTGEYLQVEVEALGSDTLRFTDGPVETLHYRLRNPEREIDISVWYERGTDRWLSLESRVGNNRVIRYLPADREIVVEAGSTSRINAEK